MDPLDPNATTLDFIDKAEESETDDNPIDGNVLNDCTTASNLVADADSHPGNDRIGCHHYIRIAILTILSISSYILLRRNNSDSYPVESQSLAGFILTVTRRYPPMVARE